MTKIDKNGRPVHPNTLANLVHAWDSDSAKKASALATKKKKELKLERERIEQKAQELAEFQKIVGDDFDSVKMLRALAVQKMEEGDVDTAIDILKNIAEYEKPKLARIEQKVEDVTLDNLTDEELDARLSEILKKD